MCPCPHQLITGKDVDLPEEDGGRRGRNKRGVCWERRAREWVLGRQPVVVTSRKKMIPCPELPFSEIDSKKETDRCTI